MITVVGMDGSPLSPQAEAALRSATLVVGGRRHLAALPAFAAARSGPGAGDAAAVGFARAGLPWDDAVVVSAHGRDLRPAVNVCRAHPKVAVLTGPGAGPAEIAAGLAGWDRRLVVCERLGSGAEQITECSPASAATRTWTDPNVVLVLAAPEPDFVIMGLGSSQRPQSHDHEAGASRSAATGEADVPGVAGVSGEVSRTGRVGWVWPRQAVPAAVGEAIPVAVGEAVPATADEGGGPPTMG